MNWNRDFLQIVNTQMLVFTELTSECKEQARQHLTDVNSKGNCSLCRLFTFITCVVTVFSFLASLMKEVCVWLGFVRAFGRFSSSESMFLINHIFPFVTPTAANEESSAFEAALAFRDKSRRWVIFILWKSWIAIISCISVVRCHRSVVITRHRRRGLY